MNLISDLYHWQTSLALGLNFVLLLTLTNLAGPTNNANPPPVIESCTDSTPNPFSSMRRDLQLSPSIMLGGGVVNARFILTRSKSKPSGRRPGSGT